MPEAALCAKVGADGSLGEIHVRVPGPEDIVIGREGDALPDGRGKTLKWDAVQKKVVVSKNRAQRMRDVREVFDPEFLGALAIRFSAQWDRESPEVQDEIQTVIDAAGASAAVVWEE